MQDHKQPEAAGDKANRPAVVHPFLFGPFFVLSLYAANIQHFPITVTFLPIAITVGLAAVLWGVLSLILKNGRKSGIVVSLFCLLFFSYAYVLDMVSYSFGAQVGRGKVVLPALGLVGILGFVVTIKSKRPLVIPTRLLNVLAASLLAAVAARIGFRTVSDWRTNEPAPAISPPAAGTAATLGKETVLPDIYYIIPDGYGRQDVLKELYDYDNAAFVDFLRRRGFYVANDACANYCHTALSLASSLNMRYIGRLQTATEARDRCPLIKQIARNAVCGELRRHGYKIVLFSSGYFATEKIQGATYFRAQRLNEFDYGLIATTPIPILMEKVLGAYTLHRERILYTLDHLPEARDSDRPVFVFAHIVCPHPPFVFGPAGRPRQPAGRYSLNDGSHWLELDKANSPARYRQGYAEQLAFLNARLEKVIDAILTRPGRPAVIILQGDHGPGSMLDKASAERSDVKERMTILSAYYFPDESYDLLYDRVSPVNTFRVVFNRYFGGNYELLTDSSYFSTSGRPYDFIDVTDRIFTRRRVRQTKDRSKPGKEPAKNPQANHL
ncbi:MAG: sulfatase-like hydrolase/transferase [Planctomycetota bacterium]|nr:sulfatase-like hydrolase/transferase [Planctomycetota bacterium]